MTSPYSPAGRRRRRRRMYWIFGISAVLIGIAYGVVQAQGESELTREYLDTAMEVARGEQAAAESFVGTIADLEVLQRSVMIDRLAELEADAADLASRLGDASPPGGMVRGHLFLQIAASNWRNGLATARSGLEALSDDPVDEEALAQLADGLVQLRVGDSAYRGFLSEMVGVDTTLQGGPFPAVAFFSSDEETLLDPRAIARRLYVTPGLTTETNLAVADLKLEPGPVGEAEGIPVVPAGTSLSAEVTVSNRGNTQAESISVRVSLVSNAGFAGEARQVVDTLQAGALTTMVFSELPVEPGRVYELIATLEVADDDPTDDVQRLRFQVNPEE